MTNALEQPNFPYYNTVDQIYHAEWTMRKLVRQELLRMSIQTLWPDGHPTKFIHVAGTSGKGSTCRFLEVGLSCVGRAGAYMSPHLFDYRERFSLNGAFAAQTDVTAAWEGRIRPHVVQMALRNSQHAHTTLESSLLIALALFEQHSIEWAAVETHLGGRYDLTRVLDAEATLLTNIGSDHAHLLGSEPWLRAMDKAGIARTGTPFFSTEQDPDNQSVIASVCAGVDAPLRMITPNQVQSFTQDVAHAVDMPLSPGSLLSASYQKWNAALALATLEHLFPDLDTGRVLQAFAEAQLPGRFWQVEPHIYADVAHNAEKLNALADDLQEKFRDTGKILVLGVAKQRVPQSIFPRIARIAKAIVVTSASFRGRDPHQVKEEMQTIAPDIPIFAISDPRAALHIAKTMRSADDIIFLTGSTYMIEQMLNPDSYMRYLNGHFGWRTETKREAHGAIQLTLPDTPRSIR